jgi:hypothetical protein
MDSGVPRGVCGVQTPPKFRSFDKPDPNSQFRRKYIRNNLIRIRVSLMCKLSGTPDQGAFAPQIPVLSVLCPSVNFFEPPLTKKNSWYATVSGMRKVAPSRESTVQRIPAVRKLLSSNCYRNLFSYCWSLLYIRTGINLALPSFHS